MMAWNDEEIGARMGGGREEGEAIVKSVMWLIELFVVF